MNIVLAVDHTMLRDGLRQSLNSYDVFGEVVCATSYTQLFELLDARQDIDVALIDLHLPGPEWCDGLHILNERWPHLRAVIMSSTDDEKAIRSILSAGAAGVIPRRMNFSAAISVLRLVMAGERFIPAAGSPFDVAEENALPIAVCYGAELTTREQGVLRELKDGLSNKEIARKLNVCEVTVKTHLSRIFRKLGVNNRVQAARVAFLPSKAQAASEQL